MRHIDIVAIVPERTTDEVYPILCDFERYPELSDAVRSVEIIERNSDRTVSRWEVNFNRGILRWTEEDVLDPVAHTIRFHQLEGDSDLFEGEWVVRGDEGGSIVEFTADLDLGIPGLSEMLEPIAEQALRANVRSILTGLLGVPIELKPVADVFGN